MAEVFISFAPEDRDWVRGLAAALTDAGFDVLWDLAPTLGQNAKVDVDSELANARAIVAVWSSVSRSSNWVRDVAQEALDRGILLPALKDIDKPPLGFRQLRCADLRTWKGVGKNAGLDELIGQIRDRIAPLPAEPEPSGEGDEVQDFERSSIVFRNDGDESSAAPPSAGISQGQASAGSPSISAKSAAVSRKGAGPADLKAGDEVGQYRIIRRLGAGGFGAVYEAANIHNEDERVALKLLLAAIAASETFAHLLRLEANALLRLKHPAVVQYRVFGRIADTDQFYLVTEYVPGPTLREWRKQNTPTLAQVRTVAIRLAQGLSAAHRRGIVHRDLAPDNVIVMQDELAEATLIDFGIARLADSDALSGAFAGKFSYAAPEQLEFDATKLGPSIDIYSFGLLMAAFTRGRPLDMGRSIESAREKRLGVPPLDDLPAGLQPVLTQLLQPNPADRPGGMEEVSLLFERMDVGAAAGGVPASVAPAGADVGEPSKSGVLTSGGQAIESAAAALVPKVEAAQAPQEPAEVDREPAPEAVEQAEDGIASGDEVAEIEPSPVDEDARWTAPPDLPPPEDEPVYETLPASLPPVRKRSVFSGFLLYVLIAAVGGGLTFALWPREKQPPVVNVPPQPQPQPEPPKPEPQPQPEPPKPEPQPQPEPPKPEPQPQPEPPKPEPQPQPEPPKPEPQPQPEPPKPEPQPQPEPPKPEPQPEPPKPEAPIASGKVEPAPAGAKVQKQNGTAYGKANADARIIYVARRDTDLKVVVGDKITIERAIKRGDSYRMPNRSDVAVSTQDAGALDVILDGKFIGRAGPDGARLIDFQATPVAYGGPAELPKPPEPEPQPEPPKPPNPEPPQQPEPQPVPSGDAISQALTAVNAIRSAAGADKVRNNSALNSVALTLAQFNAGRGVAGGTNPSQVLQMLIDAGYGNARAGQAHARRQKSAADAVNFWSGRADTAAMLTDPNMVAMGFAVAKAGDGTLYYTMVIAYPPQ